MSGVLILKDLQQLRDMNARIAEVSGIVDRQMSYVLGELARALSALGAAGADAAPTPQFLPGPANVAHLMGTLPKNQVQDCRTRCTGRPPQRSGRPGRPSNG